MQNMKHLITEPTRITNTSATILDQIITNTSTFVKETRVTLPISSNDHCTIGALLNFKVKTEIAYQRTIWNYKAADFDQF